MHDFPTFSALSLLYFAAVSYAETAHRLNKPELAPSFLLHTHPTFGPASKTLCERALHIVTPAQAAQLREGILRAIAPINVAGLGNESRRNWYPVEAADLIEAAPKLNASPEEIHQLLQRCGF